MGLTTKAIMKLSDKNRHTLETYRTLYLFKDGLSADYPRKIRGYLECLCDSGMITRYEIGVLINWYLREG